MASVYPLPIISVQKSGSTSYIVNARVDSDTDVYYQPTSYKISIINNTVGGELANIADVDMVNNSYTFTSHGGEDLVISVSAFFSGNTETTSIIDYTTELVPITNITIPVSSTLTISNNSDLSAFQVSSLTISPPTASVLYGTRPKVKYEIIPFLDNGVIDTGISVDEDGVIHATNAKPGEYIVKITPADEVHLKTSTVTGKFIVVKPMEKVEIYGDDTKTKIILPSDGNGGYEDVTFTFDKARALPLDATDRRLRYELYKVVWMAGNWHEILSTQGVTIGEYTGVVNIDGTITPPTVLAPWFCRIYAYARNSGSFSYNIYATYEFSIGQETSGWEFWSDKYETCPEIMTTMDFNAINLMVQSLREKLNFPYNISYITADDAMVNAKTEFETLFSQVKYMIENGTYNNTPIYQLIHDNGSDIPTTFTYAPTKKQWNTILEPMRRIYRVISPSP